MYEQPPRIDAATPEGRLKQMEDFLFSFVRKYNDTISELTHEIEVLKGVK